MILVVACILVWTGDAFADQHVVPNIPPKISITMNGAEFVDRIYATTNPSAEPYVVNATCTDDILGDITDRLDIRIHN
ncbi:MAG: hypothetical protein EB828_03625, partial [Nitrosopumilus sp. D6]